MSKNTTRVKVKLRYLTNFFLIIIVMSSCGKPKIREVEIFETSAGGNQLAKLSEFPAAEKK